MSNPFIMAGYAAAAMNPAPDTTITADSTSHRLEDALDMTGLMMNHQEYRSEMHRAMALRSEAGDTLDSNDYQFIESLCADAQAELEPLIPDKGLSFEDVKAITKKYTTLLDDWGISRDDQSEATSISGAIAGKHFNYYERAVLFKTLNDKLGMDATFLNASFGAPNYLFKWTVKKGKEMQDVYWSVENERFMDKDRLEVKFGLDAYTPPFITELEGDKLISAHYYEIGRDFFLEKNMPQANRYLNIALQFNQDNLDAHNMIRYTFDGEAYDARIHHTREVVRLTDSHTISEEVQELMKEHEKVPEKKKDNLLRKKYKEDSKKPFTDL